MRCIKTTELTCGERQGSNDSGSPYRMTNNKPLAREAYTSELVG